MFLFACCLLAAMTVSPFAQNKNEYAHNPLTPGYGTSDYFELMPDKVGNAPVNREAALKHRMAGAAATITRGRTLVFQIGSSQSSNRMTVSINTPAGRRVYNMDGVSYHSGSNSMTLPHQLPNGVYFVSVSGPDVESRAMRVVVVR